MDVFANDSNKKCAKFFSKWWCRGTSGVDAFCYNWEKEVCWIVPPPSLVARVILRIQQSNVVGVLIVPKWRSAPFWPLLYKDGVLVKELQLLCEYVHPKNFFWPSKHGNQVFTEKSFSGNVLVLRVMSCVG